MTAREQYDVVVIGAGLFGIYAALFLKRRGLRTLLIEREASPWQKASLVNQARAHTGYHYPRSIATAKLAREHRERFHTEHADFIDSSIHQYYAIDKRGSLTSAEQFERFCEYLDIPCREAKSHAYISNDRIDALYKVEEATFDPMLMRRFYLQQLKDESVESLYCCSVKRAEINAGNWFLELDTEKGEMQVSTSAVINATYANLNAVNSIFNLPASKVVHEISEMVFVYSRALRNTGLTVMDGPFMSIMPFGKTTLHSLSSVLYTHQTISSAEHPTFVCQSKRPDCSPQSLKPCLSCRYRPTSNAEKMLKQLKLYLHDSTDIVSHGSLYTVKTKLQSSFIDDARPTDIKVVSQKPLFATIFSGKINSIYEIETLANAL